MAYKVLANKNEIISVSKELLNKEEVSFDTETTSLDTHALSTKIVGFGFTWKDNQGVYIPFNVEHGLSEEELLDLFKPVLESEEVGKIGQNIKYDARICHRFGIDLKNITFDTNVANYCLFSGRLTHNLDDLSLHYLNIIKIRTKNLLKMSKSSTMEDIDPKIVGHYCCEDTDTVWKLTKYFRKLLERPEYNYAYKLFYEIELPLIPVLTNMECNGVQLDTEYLFNLRKSVVNKINRLTQFLYKKVGREVSLTKARDLQAALYDELQVQGDREVPLTPKSLERATDAYTLSLFSDNTAVRAILKIKDMNKLLTTYLVPIPEMVSKYTGYLHASFNQTVAVTGRLSSSGPNLQNIPSRKELGRKVRQAFVSRWKDSGGKILAADYSQAELRILAHMSQEPTLLTAYLNNEDVHDKVMNLLNKKNLPIKLSRSHTKNMNFGMIYGMGPGKMSKEIGCDRLTAQSLIRNYLDTMPKVEEFIEKSKAHLRLHGYTETLFGRRRYISKVYSENKLKRWEAERESVNHPIQGTNADAIKLAMVEIHNQIMQRNLKSCLIMQVHDELVLDVHPEELDIMLELVTNSMEQCIELDVPMLAEGQYADNWSDAH